MQVLIFPLLYFDYNGKTISTNQCTLDFLIDFLAKESKYLVYQKNGNTKLYKKTPIKYNINLNQLFYVI